VNERRSTTESSAELPDGNSNDAEDSDIQDELPSIDFATFVLSLSHSALVNLGDAPSPVDGKLHQNLPMARQTIDLLVLLEQKTTGNLSGEEERVLQQVLYDVRLRYVEVSRKT
jgi:hypothetical protein